MTISARGYLIVSFLEQLTVLAGPVEVELVDSQVGVEPAHKGPISMASAAEFWNPRSWRHSFEASIFCPFHILLQRVAAMAVSTAEPELPVDIAGHGLSGGAKFVSKLSVAIEAGVFLGRKGCREDGNEGEEEESGRQWRACLCRT